MDNQIVRTATVNRVTKETRIRCTLCLDGSGQYDINTGIGFFDHMLSGFARHGLFDLKTSLDIDVQNDVAAAVQSFQHHILRRAVIIVKHSRVLKEIAHFDISEKFFMSNKVILSAVDFSFSRFSCCHRH